MKTFVERIGVVESINMDKIVKIKKRISKIFLAHEGKRWFI